VIQINGFAYDRLSSMVITCDLIVHLKSIVLLEVSISSHLVLVNGLQAKE